MKILLFVFLLLAPLLVKADEPRYTFSFTSPNGKYELRVNPDERSRAIWSLVEKDTKKILYEIDGQFQSFTVLVSDDGKNVVAIDDYSERKPEDNPEILQFFLDGKKVKSYKFSELLENTNIITHSVSHFYFLLNANKLALSGTKLNLTTFELFNYEFDINTGEMLKKERDPRLSGGAVYAYGDIRGSMSGKHQMKIECLLYGEMPAGKIIKFESKDFIYDVRSMYDAVIIKDGKLVAHLGLSLACNNK
jgi:hypothetical protein